LLSVLFLMENCLLRLFLFAHHSFIEKLCFKELPMTSTKQVIVVSNFQISLISILWKNELCLSFNEEEHFFYVIIFKEVEFSFIVPLWLHKSAYPTNELN